MVRSLASATVRRAFPAISQEDLEQEGFIALCVSATRYDKRRGVTLGNYSKHRVRGAMADTIRTEDRDSLRSKMDYDCDISDPKTEAQYFESARSTEETRPERAQAREQLRTVLNQVLHRLDERDRQIIALRYGRDMTLLQVGEQLGLGESRVCQLEKLILEKLRTELARRHVNGVSDCLWG